LLTVLDGIKFATKKQKKKQERFLCSCHLFCNQQGNNTEVKLSKEMFILHQQQELEIQSLIKRICDAQKKRNTFRIN